MPTQTFTTPSGKLSHPQWTPLISRIPRAARASCRTLLTQIIGRIVSNPNETSAWEGLLHFGPVILAKPKIYGANRNLSNIINRCTAAWGKDNRPADQEQRSMGRRPVIKSTEDTKLAAAVMKKLEAGNFKAAIRIICSSDMPAQVNPDTLKAL